VHASGKKIRFWNAPDNPQSWQTLMNIGVDYINTDHINELGSFLYGLNKK
jgi:alkaline phosphatase